MFRSFRKDGWPLCPQCGEDELYSFVMLKWMGEGERPTLKDCLTGGHSCPRFSRLRGDKSPQSTLVGSSYRPGHHPHNQLAYGAEVMWDKFLLWLGGKRGQKHCYDFTCHQFKQRGFECVLDLYEQCPQWVGDEIENEKIEREGK